jgi:hypothetical protein
MITCPKPHFPSHFLLFPIPYSFRANFKKSDFNSSFQPSIFNPKSEINCSSLCSSNSIPQKILENPRFPSIVPQYQFPDRFCRDDQCPPACPVYYQGAPKGRVFSNLYDLLAILFSSPPIHSFVFLEERIPAPLQPKINLFPYHQQYHPAGDDTLPVVWHTTIVPTGSPCGYRHEVVPEHGLSTRLV